MNNINAIAVDIAKSVTKEVAKNIRPKEVVDCVFGSDGIIPVLGRDIWIGNYHVSVKIK